MSTPASPAVASADMKRRALTALQWGVSVAALVYALWGVDAATLWKAVRGYPLWGMLALLLPLCADYCCMGARLKIMLPGHQPFCLGLKAAVLCLGYNNILPAKAGDVLKIAYLSRRTGFGISVIGPCILWERLMDVFMLTCFGLLAMLLAKVPASSVLTLGLLALVAGGFWLARHFSPFFHALYSKLPHARAAEVLHNLHHHAVDSVTLRWASRGFGMSLLIWLAHCGTFLGGFVLVSGLDLSLAQMLTVYVVTSVGTALPSSPGSVGVFEGAMVLALSWYGVEHSTALGFALFMHAVYFVPVSLAAVLLDKNS